MIKAVLFDLDGTIANSLLDLALSVNYALCKFCFPERETEQFKYFAGDGMPKMVERALPDDKKNKTTVSEVLNVFLKYYSEHYCDNTREYDGMTELIDNLKEKNIAVAVVTNKAQEMAQKVVKKLYGERFDLILGKREGIPAKPDPAAAFMAMRELGVSPEECVFVGDSQNDVLTGVNSGAYPVGVLWGFREKEELVLGGATSIINSPKELLAIIESLS